MSQKKEISVQPYQNSIELDIDLYFWMIDIADIEDDQRNQVEIENQKVKLFREHSQLLLNGFLIGKIMSQLRKTIIKKTKKPFPLDPNLNNLKVQSIQSAKEYNWNCVFADLKKFNIKISNDEKMQIMKDGQYTSIIEILRNLYDFEQNLQVFKAIEENHVLKSPQSQQKQNGHQNELQENKEEMLEKYYKKNKKQLAQKADSHQNELGNEYQNEIFEGEDLPNRKLLKKNGLMKQENNHTNRKSIQLQLFKDQNFEFDKSMNQGEDIQASIIEENEDFLQSLEDDMSYMPLIEKNDDINLMHETDSPAHFIILSLKISFKIKESQVAGLLMHNNKYLIQACVKGQKNQAFKNIKAWYQLLISNVGKLIYILQKETYEQTKKTLNILKSGLFSQDIEVTNICCQFFTRFRVILNENPENPGIMQLINGFWKWLTQKQAIKKQIDQISAKKRVNGKNQENNELSSFLQEEGLKGFLHAQRRHSENFNKEFCIFLISTGSDNYQSLFIVNLQNSCDNMIQYLTVILEINEILCQTQNGKQIFIDSEIYLQIIEFCLQILNNHQNQIIDSQYLNLIQISLILISDLWKAHLSKFRNQRAKKLCEDILFVLKKTCRDPQKTTSMISVSLLASLLDQFATEKNEYAPKIYKVLTFLLIDFYNEIDMRIEILNYFINLFKKHPRIPIQILCDPYFKQIIIGIEKRQDESKNIEMDIPEMNQADFDLLYQICAHPKISQSLACQIIIIVSQMSQRNLVYTRSSLNILFQLLSIFENNSEVYACIQRQVDISVSYFLNIDHKKYDIYQNVMQLNRKSRSISKKKLSIGIKKDFNAQVEQVQPNTVQNRNSIKQKNKSIAVEKRQSNLEIDFYKSDQEPVFATDQHILSLMDPNKYQNQIQNFNQLIISEKMIVNYLKMFLISGIKPIQNYIFQKCLKTYNTIIESYSFKNKGIIHLMNMIDPNWKSIPIQKSIKNKEIQKKNISIAIEPEAALRLPQIQTTKKESIEQRKMEKEKKSFITTLDKSKTVHKNHLTISSTSPPIQDYNKLILKYQSPQKDDKFQLQLYKTRNDSLERLKTFDLNEKIQNGQCPPEEKKKFELLIKSCNKIIRAMFNKYSALSNNKMPIVATLTFEDVKSQLQRMNLYEIYAFLNDFKLIQKMPTIKRDDFKKFIVSINLRQINNIAHKTELDYLGFIEFLQNLAFYFSNQEISRPSIFFPKFFEYLKQVSLQSDQPLFQRLFQDPYSSQFGDPELIKELTKRVRQDPNYILPPGFLKYKQPIINQNIKAPSHLKESNRICMEIVNDIIFKKFGFNCLHKEMEGDYQWAVKFDTHRTLIKKQLQPSYLNINKKYQFQKSDDLQDEQQFENTYKLNGSLSDSKLYSQNRQNSQETRNQNMYPESPKKSLQYPIVNTKMSPSLKLKLLENIDDPEFIVIQETAIMLEDMIRTVEKGNRALSPKTKANIYFDKPSNIQKNPINQKLQEKQQQEKLEMEKKDYLFKVRKQKLKIILDENKQRMEENEILYKQKLKEDNEYEQQKLQQKMFLKQKFYEKIKSSYDQNRLPSVLEQQQVLKEKQKQEKLKRFNDKLAANQKVKNDIDSLREIFELKIQSDYEKEKKRILDEQLQKQKLDLKNEQYKLKAKKRLELKLKRLEQNQNSPEQIQNSPDQKLNSPDQKYNSPDQKYNSPDQNQKSPNQYLLSKQKSRGSLIKIKPSDNIQIPSPVNITPIIQKGGGAFKKIDIQQLFSPQVQNQSGQNKSRRKMEKQLSTIYENNNQKNVPQTQKNQTQNQIQGNAPNDRNQRRQQLQSKNQEQNKKQTEEQKRQEEQRKLEEQKKQEEQKRQDDQKIIEQQKLENEKKKSPMKKFQSEKNVFSSLFKL